MRRNLATSIKVNVMLLCILGMIFSVLLVAHYLTNVFILLGVSLIVTYLLLEPVEVLQKLLHRFFPKRLSARLLRREPSLSFYRALSVVIVYLFIFLVITVLLVRVVPSLSRQVQGFAGDFPRYIQQLEQRLQDLAPPNSQSNSIAKIAAHPVNPSPANTPADKASDIDPEQTG